MRTRSSRRNPKKNLSYWSGQRASRNPRGWPRRSIPPYPRSRLPKVGPTWPTGSPTSKLQAQGSSTRWTGPSGRRPSPRRRRHLQTRRWWGKSCSSWKSSSREQRCGERVTSSRVEYILRMEECWRNSTLNPRIICDLLTLLLNNKILRTWSMHLGFLTTGILRQTSSQVKPSTLISSTWRCGKNDIAAFIRKQTKYWYPIFNIDIDLLHLKMANMWLSCKNIFVTFCLSLNISLKTAGSRTLSAWKIAWLILEQ